MTSPARLLAPGSGPVSGRVRKHGNRYVLPCGCLQTGTTGQCYRYRHGPKASSFRDCECSCHLASERPSVHDIPDTDGDLRTAIVYFIRCKVTGRVKIGTTLNLQQRLSALRGSSPTELEVIGFVDSSDWPEKDLHGRFREHRLHGEWFEGVDQILGFARRQSIHFNTGERNLVVESPEKP